MATKPCVDTIELPKELKDYLISQREVNAKKGLDQKQSDLLTAKELQHKSENQLHNVYNQLNIDGYETKLAETITKPVSEVKPEPTIISKEQQPTVVSKEEGSGVVDKASNVGGDVGLGIQQGYAKKAMNDFINSPDMGYSIHEEGGKTTFILSEAQVRSANGLKGGDRLQPHEYTNIELTKDEKKQLNKIESDKELGDIDGLEYAKQKRALAKKIFERASNELQQKANEQSLSKQEVKDNTKQPIDVSKEEGSGVGGDVETKQQIENFGVNKDDVEPVHSVISQVFSGLKKAGLTAAKTVGDWVGIGKGGVEKPYTLKMNGKDVQVKNTSPDVVNGFYSPLEKVITDSKFDKLPAKQWIEKYANSEEAKWTGLKDWLAQQQGSVSKADIQQYLKDNRIQVVEVVKGDRITTLTKEDFKQTNSEVGIVSQGNGYTIEKSDNPNRSNPFDLYYEGRYIQENKSIDDAIDRAIRDSRNRKATADSGVKFQQYQLDGEKSNYKEILVTMPQKTEKANYEVVKKGDLYYPTDKVRNIPTSPYPTFEQAKAESDRLNKGAVERTSKDTFKSSHFDEPNILVHLRMNTRTDAEGKKVLFLEEVQSDWGQQGKKEGFRKDDLKLTAKKASGDNRFDVYQGDRLIRSAVFAQNAERALAYIENNPNEYGSNSLKIPTAPFVTDTNSWTKLGLKVALKEAVKQGADKIAWTTGEQQNDRYDLSKQVDYVTKHNESIVNKEDNSIDVTISVNNGLMGVVVDKDTGKIKSQNGSSQFGDFKGKGLDEVIGKDIADKILKLDDTEHKLQGEGLKVGGKGMKGFYGSPTEGSLGIVGNVAKSLFKQEPKTTEIVTDSGYDADRKNVEWDKVKVNVVKVRSGEREGLYFVELDGGGLFTVIKDHYFEKAKEAEAFGKQHIKEVQDQSKFLSTQHSIDITPELKASVEGGQPLFKDAEAQYRIESGKNIVEAIKDFNGSPRATVALTHEIMHPTVVAIIDGAKEGNEVGAKHTETIVNEFNKANPNNKVTTEDLIKGNDAFKDGTTSKQYRAVQEFIAKSWEKYHREGGKGFSESFQKVLDQITQAFKSVYKSISGKELTPELRKMFDDILGKEQSLPTQEVKGSATVPIVKESGNSEPPNKPPVTKESEFQEPENEKDLKKLASNIPNEGKLREYDSRETIEKYFWESPQNNQKVLRQELMPALEHGEMLIQKARKLYGEKEFVEKTLDFIEKSNLTPDSKALMYISLENAMAREKLLNPNSVDIQKKQNLVNSKSQAFLRSNSIAINFGKLRKIAEVNFDVTKITDKFFSAKELEDKGTVERSIQADADTINKEAEVLEMRDLDIQEKIDNAVDAEITKINEALPPIKKRNAEKAIQALENFQKKIRGKAYDATIGVPLAIIDSGITVIKKAIKAGVYISDAIELGVKHIKEKYGKDWQKEGEFRADMIAGFKEEGINKEAKTAPSKVIKDALIEAGFGREFNIKNKEGIKEKKYILDWKKLTGEEGSIDRMKETVNDVFEKRGYTPEEINDIQLSLNDAYNNIRASVIENSISELNRRNNKVTTPEQKSAARKLAELYNYGLFEKNPAEYDVLLAKVIGVEGITKERFEQIHELAKGLGTLYSSKFNGFKLNDLHLKTAIQSIDEKMRMLLHNQEQGHGSSRLKVADIVRTYMDASQRMALNTLKQAAENPISGLEQNIISGIDGMLSRSSTPELRKQKRALAVNVYKDMVLAGGTNFGDVGTTFVNRGNLDVYINRMSDSQLVHAIASTAIGKVTLDAADSFFKAKLTEQKFTYNLIKVLTEKRLIDGKLVDGMKREDAINYVSEKLTGQSFKKAQETAKEIIGKVNVGGKKIVNDSQPFVDRLANDIVKAALINGKVITSDMVDAAYNAAYNAAGRNLGHVANNPISDGIQKVTGAMENKINIARRDKEYKKAAKLTYQSILFRNILNPYVGGGTNWVVLKLEKNGLGLVSGLYNGGKTKLDLTTESGLKNAEKALYEEARDRDAFMRGAIGGVTSVLTAMLFYGIANTDEYRKWRNKNKWASKYLDIITPEDVLRTMAKKNKELDYYVANLLNQNETYNKGKKAAKLITNAGNGKSEKALALTGELMGSSIGVPVPWRLIRDGQNIWLGANGEAPYKIPNKPTVGFWNGYLKAGMYDYIDNNPLFKDK